MFVWAFGLESRAWLECALRNSGRQQQLTHHVTRCTFLFVCVRLPFLPALSSNYILSVVIAALITWQLSNGSAPR